MASAAATTAMIILPLGTEAPVVASVVAAGPTATTYAMGCGADFPPDISGVSKEVLCSSILGLTITQGPSTLAYTAMTNMATDLGGPPTNVKGVLHCALTGFTAAVCTNSFEGLDKVNMPMQTGDPAIMSEYQAQFEALKVPETTTLIGAEMPVIGPVTITAGVEKLSGSGGSGGQGKQANATMATTGSSATTAISSVSVTTNPAGGGVNSTTAKTTSKVAASTPSGDAGASHTSSAKASSTSKSAAAAVVVNVADGLSLLVGALAMAMFGLWHH